MKLKENNNNLNLAELKKLIAESMDAMSTLNRGFLLEEPEFLDEKSKTSIRNAPYPMKAIFILGPAGAGKTFVSDKVGIPKNPPDQQGFHTVNPDQRIEDVFPAFGVTMQFVKGFPETEEEAAEEEANPSADWHVKAMETLQQGVRRILQNASQGHTHNLILTAKPLLFDTTGEDVDKMGDRMIELKKLGYKVGVMMVNVPPEVSVSADANRDRTVGADRTAKISNDFQKDVVAMQGYQKKLAGSGVEIFGGGIYPNVYDLRDGSLRPGVTEEHVKAMGNPSPEDAKAILDQMIADVDAFKSFQHPEDSAAGKIVKAMIFMVESTGGMHGQNMADIEMIHAQAFRDTQHPKWKLSGEAIASEPVMQAAAAHLASLGGADAQAQKGQRSRKSAPFDGKSVRDVTGNSNPVPVGGELRPDKDGEVRTRRFEESFEQTIHNIVRAAVLKTKKELD